MIGDLVGPYRITGAYASGFRAIDVTDGTRVHLDIAQPDPDDWRDRSIQHLRRRALTVEEAVALVRDLSEIAAHAHARRILHSAIAASELPQRKLRLNCWQSDSDFGASTVSGS